MNMLEQRKLLELWRDYVSAEVSPEPANNAQLVGFYLDVVKESELYTYGGVFEVFDVITNGVFDPIGIAKTTQCRKVADKNLWIKAA